ncbi:MAG: ABC transporter ATP-binding protein [Patescibacteria group bacterium]
MEKPIIEIRNISKKYNIAHQRGGYVALRDVLMNVLKSPFYFLKSKAKQVAGFEKKEEFWALKDVNFSVQKGEVVGIIGANGAGKSTLLKILSQITPPTEGEIILRGRVGSLLEVGTGFHPELTGRENIFLNGAILGMKKKEIAQKFDEIVEFAGIGKFLDTPVKYYSSGMYVRLAFSVAAYMEPDILIIDEVLAVGDAEFQKKCLGKMEEITKEEGRTILFVSHNMEAIRRMCSHCILLDKGKITFKGNTGDTLSAYDKSDTKLGINKGGNRKNQSRRGSGTLSFTDIKILDDLNKERNIFKTGEAVRFKMSYVVCEEMRGLHASVCFFSNKTRELLTSIRYEIKSGVVAKNETGTATIEVELTIIRPGEYSLYFWLGDEAATKQGTPTNYDIVDGITKPLIIEAKNEEEKKLTGSFSLPSKIIK